MWRSKRPQAGGCLAILLFLAHPTVIWIDPSPDRLPKGKE
jgi:hypothetical protein